METVTLTASPREVTGKKVKNLRREGITPIHLYGGKLKPLALQAATQDVRAAVNTAGRSQPITVEVEGAETALTFVREIARHPVSGELQHVDFLRVDVNTPVEAVVDLVITGEAPATRGGAAQFLRGVRTIPVRALPLSVPTEIVVDISGLEEIGDNIRVEDLPLPEDVEVIGAPDAVVARIAANRVAPVDLAAEEEAEEGVEGEEAAEGEGEGDEGSDE